MPFTTNLGRAALDFWPLPEVGTLSTSISPWIIWTNCFQGNMGKHYMVWLSMGSIIESKWCKICICNWFRSVNTSSNRSWIPKCLAGSQLTSCHIHTEFMHLQAYTMVFNLNSVSYLQTIYLVPQSGGRYLWWFKRLLSKLHSFGPA
jgi:hypothetical protein